VQVFKAVPTSKEDQKYEAVTEEKFGWDGALQHQKTKSSLHMIQCGIVRTNSICVSMKNAGGNDIGLNRFSFYRVCPVDSVKIPNKCYQNPKAPQPRTINLTDKFKCRSELN